MTIIAITGHVLTGLVLAGLVVCMGLILQLLRYQDRGAKMKEPIRPDQEIRCSKCGRLQRDDPKDGFVNGLCDECLAEWADEQADLFRDRRRAEIGGKGE